MYVRPISHYDVMGITMLERHTSLNGLRSLQQSGPNDLILNVGEHEHLHSQKNPI